MGDFFNCCYHPGVLDDDCKASLQGFSKIPQLQTRGFWEAVPAWYSSRDKDTYIAEECNCMLLGWK